MPGCREVVAVGTAQKAGDEAWSWSGMPWQLSVPPLIRQILSGQKVTVVRCEEINVSGSFFRNKLKYTDYLHSELRLRDIFGIGLPGVLWCHCEAAGQSCRQ